MSADDRKESIADAKVVSSILSSLASPVRLMIICSLMDGEKNVGQFAELLGTTMGNISQHLRILEYKGVIQSRKEGNKVFYRITNKDIIKLIKEIKKVCKKGRFGDTQ